MNKPLKMGATIFILGLALGGSVAAWATLTSQGVRAKTYLTPPVPDVPVPWPLTDEEKAELLADEDDETATVDFEAVAMERAVARGAHLVNSRYPCIECHGKDWAGGVMLDDPMVGTLYGPNLTGGAGSRVGNWTVADWDRKVRRGVNPDGTSGPMPSEDFVKMSDQELSDILAYLRTFPPVDHEVPPLSFGPLGTLLLATGQIAFPAERFASVDSHPRLPPATEPTAEFGAHLANVCVGCHRETFEGGPHPAAPPEWAPASNLTPVEGGVMSHYDLEAFKVLMRTGVKPDGEPALLPMSLMPQYNQHMTDVELEALYVFLQTLPPVPTGG